MRCVLVITVDRKHSDDKILLHVRRTNVGQMTTTLYLIIQVFQILSS